MCPGLSPWPPNRLQAQGRQGALRQLLYASLLNSLLFRGLKHMQSQAWGTHTRSSPLAPFLREHSVPRGLVGVNSHST